MAICQECGKTIYSETFNANWSQSAPPTIGCDGSTNFCQCRNPKLEGSGWKIHIFRFCEDNDITGGMRHNFMHYTEKHLGNEQEYQVWVGEWLAYLTQRVNDLDDVLLYVEDTAADAAVLAKAMPIIHDIIDNHADVPETWRGRGA